VIEKPRPAPTPTTEAQRRVLHVLKRRGPLATADLAGDLGVTEVAARQHGQALESLGLVAQDTRLPQGRGRPASVWRLTDAAAPHFPDSHARLTLGLIDATRRALGSEGLQRVIDVRARDQVEAYRARMPSPSASLKKRVEALADIRSAEGYMAEVEQERPGVYLLIENHCPICEAASACQGLCAAELEVFRMTLGTDARVERTEHVLSEGRRCVYRVTKA